VIDQLAQRDSEWREMAFRLTKDKDLADEIVQEMYLKSHTFRDCRHQYIYTVLRNLFIDTTKRKEVLLDDFTRFEIIEDEYVSLPEFDELAKNLTWYERTMFVCSTLQGQRPFSRQTEIHIQTVHRINKMVKEKLIWQVKNQNSEQ
jgi:DNA-directed RNA polymerase specialized sigma24 family protein